MTTSTTPAWPTRSGSSWRGQPGASPAACSPGGDERPARRRRARPGSPSPMGGRVPAAGERRPAPGAVRPLPAVTRAATRAFAPTARCRSRSQLPRRGAAGVAAAERGTRPRRAAWRAAGEAGGCGRGAAGVLRDGVPARAVGSRHAGAPRRGVRLGREDFHLTNPGAPLPDSVALDLGDGGGFAGRVRGRAGRPPTRRATAPRWRCAATTAPRREARIALAHLRRPRAPAPDETWPLQAEGPDGKQRGAWPGSSAPRAAGRSSTP